MNHAKFKLSQSPIPYSSDRPLIPKTEAQRSESTKREYTLSESERQAIIERYGAPIMPFRRSRTHYHAKGTKG